MLDPRWRQIIIEAYANLLQHRLRTLLSGLGIVIGVAAISAVLAVGDGLEAFARAQIAETTNILNIALRSNTSKMVGGRRIPIRESDRFVLDTASLNKLTAGLPSLAGATLWETGTAEVAYPDTGGVLLNLVGTLPGGLSLGDVAISAGRDFSAEDLATERAVCLLSETEVEHLRPVAGELGTLSIEGRQFVVIGLLAEDGPPTVAVLQTLAARVDIDPSQISLPMAVIQATRIEDVDALQSAFTSRLDAAHPGWQETASLVAYRMRIAQATRAMRLFKAFMVAITGIALLVGGIGIMNVLLMAVGERTREIGIRRAMGARAVDIQRQLLVESVLMCGVGAAVGAVLGISGAYLIAFVLRRVSEAPFQAAVTAPSVLFAVAASVLVGMAFGVYPARRAARLAPVDAIRHE